VNNRAAFKRRANQNSWTAAFAAVALSGVMFADNITSASGTLSAFPNGFSSSTPIFVDALTPPASPAQPFWNNTSLDSVSGNHNMNIGDLLTDSGGFTGTPSVLGSDTVSQALSAADPTQAPAFSLVRDTAAYYITMLFADSSLATGNASVGTVFGSYAGGVFTPIYTEGDVSSPTGMQAFNPTAAGNSYGFYATVCYAVGICETYTSGNGNSGNSPGGSSWNHFALFQLASGGYVIGFEDTNGISAEGSGDFNDLVVEIFAVPEPANLGIMGLGLAALVFFKRLARRAIGSGSR
jgi:hypothetical protein